VRALVVSQWWQYSFSHHTFSFLSARKKVFDSLNAKLVLHFAVLRGSEVSCGEGELVAASPEVARLRSETQSVSVNSSQNTIGFMARVKLYKSIIS
jgi:hypothetical protein